MMFKIGDFSKLCRVPVSALRYYADIGLLEPINIDSFTGYRYYSVEQLPRLNRILALKDLGLSLEQIGQMLNESVAPEEIRGMLRLQQAKIQQQVEAEQARLARVSVRLRQIEQEGKMPEQEVVIKRIETQNVLSAREIIPLPQGVAELITAVFGAIMPQGIQPTAPPFSIFHDPEFKPENLDVEVAIPVAASVNQTVAYGEGKQLSVRELPAIETAACIIHKGSYDDLMDSYAAIGQWIESNGYKIVGPPHEIYLSPPEGDKEAITEIQYPIEKV